MRAICVLVLAMCGAASAPAQGGQTFPPAAFGAITVAVINDTHSPEVEKGAESALAAWGKFKLTEDAENADLTLRFDKTSEHSGASSEKTGDDGKSSYSYGMTFGSTIHIYFFNYYGDSEFYTAKTGDSKQKAGAACVHDFREAYRAAQPGR